MKTTKILTALMIGLSIFTTSCSKDDAATTQTPTPTTSANITYKIDGNAISCNDGKGEEMSGLLMISGHDATQPTMTGIVISIQTASLAVGTYKIAKNAFSGTDRANFYYLDNSATGGSFKTYDDQLTTSDNVTITKYDAATKTISGTFSLSATNTGTSTKHVFTEGVFTNIKW